MEGKEPNPIWQSDMTKIWARAAGDCAYLMSVIDCFTLEIVGWNLSQSCRTENTLAAAEQAVLTRFSSGSPEARMTLIADVGAQLILPDLWRRSRGWKAHIDEAWSRCRYVKSKNTHTA